VVTQAKQGTISAPPVLKPCHAIRPPALVAPNLYPSKRIYPAANANNTAPHSTVASRYFATKNKAKPGI
jgi:hypothetical protein